MDKNPSSVAGHTKKQTPPHAAADDRCAHHLRHRNVDSAGADFCAGVGIHNAVGACGLGAMQRHHLRRLLQIVRGAPQEQLLRGLPRGEGQGPHDMPVAVVQSQHLTCRCKATNRVINRVSCLRTPAGDMGFCVRGWLEGGLSSRRDLQGSTGLS